MSSFDTLQSRFVDQEIQAFGLRGQGAAITQPAMALPAGDDAALWGWFNTLPKPGPIYAPSASDFFTAYSAVIGALVPSGSLLDPIAAAQARLAEWGSAPATWSIDSAGLNRLLAAASGLTFHFDAVPTPPAGYFGLFGGLPPLDPSATFASGTVKATVACNHLSVVRPQPGDWYVSSALSLAYRTPGAAPWNPASAVNWDTAFGPNGTLRWMTTGLVVASGLSVSAGSTAPFDAVSQSLVEAGVKAAGAWPYYLPATAAKTMVSFDDAGRLDVAITGKSKTTVVLATIVQSAATYLGV
ncbi:hypothetical protein DA075_31195 [Methylobacterium currus]|uniref:Uncharacterized protein n=1 Tax=Methylobacterium currus TaxID=2051553 RepID=A0A2R4WV00_9HYPH|nr:hypothetical protein [Methylobacterium currus]AWB25367.1 hypothetical protein DA075_31195 [Methylobacterium currus]